MTATSRTPATRRRRVTDERILDAACHEFANAGYHGAHVDRIAADAATTKMTLYARFESKEGLFSAALERETQALASCLVQAYETDEELPADERLHRYVHTYFAFCEQRPDGFKLLFIDDSTERFRRMREDITDRIAILVARYYRKGEPTVQDHLVATLIIGATHNGAGAATTHGVPVSEAAALTERFLAAALLGLRPRDALPA
jgi:AcrR family transcriptional regulator